MAPVNNFEAENIILRLEQEPVNEKNHLQVSPENIN